MRWFNKQPKRTGLQQRALETALKIYNSDPEKYKDTMFCPYCGSPLVKSGERKRFETLSEHVSDPNGTPSMKDEYICSAEGLFNYQYLFGDNPDNQIGCEFGILHSWNGDCFGIENGGSYYSEYRLKLYKLSKQSIINKRVIDQWLQEDDKHLHSSALNTSECESRISIYKDGLPKCTMLPAWLTLNIIQLTIDWYYIADKFGRVIETRFHIGFHTMPDNNGLRTVGVWPWRSWGSANRIFKKSLIQAKKSRNEGDKLKYYSSLLKAFSTPYNRSWVWRLHYWWINHRYWYKAKSTLRYFGIEEFISEYSTDQFLSRFSKE